MGGQTLAVLNPWRTIDQHMMDDSDVAGPILFCLLFGTFLLLVGLLLPFAVESCPGVVWLRRGIGMECLALSGAVDELISETTS